MADIEAPATLADRMNVGTAPTSSAKWAVEITPADDDLIKRCRRLRVGTGGGNTDLVVKFTNPNNTAETETVTYVNVADGERFDIGGGVWITVMATTSCSDIVAEF